MNPMTPPSPYSNGHDGDTGDTARQLLAPLYGEAPSLDLGEAAEFEAVRDLVVDWVDDAEGAEFSPEARTALLDRALADTTESSLVSPIGGAVWVRRNGKGHALALTSRFEALPGDLLILPHGTRAEVRLPDKSSVLLKDESRFVVGHKEGRNQGQLLAGRLYAWVEHQVRAAFHIATPLGTAAVLGTQFDLDLEEPRKVHLLVTKGKVEFYSRKGEKTSMSKIVTRNRLLSASAQETTVRRLSPLEARRRTAWVRGENPRRGRFSVLGALLVVLVVGLVGYWFYNRNADKQGEESWAITQETVLLDQTAPISFATTGFEPGKKWRVRAQIYLVDEEGKVSEQAVRFITVLSEALPASPSSGARTVATIEEFLVAGEQARDFAALKGMRFEYVIAANGELETVKALDSGERTDGPMLDALGAAMTLSSVAPLYPAATRAPGDSWHYDSRFPLPGYHQSLAKISTDLLFEGYSQKNGVALGVVREQSLTEITGPIHFGRETKPPLVLDIYVDRIIARTTGLYYVDPQAGRVVEGELWSRTAEIDGHIDMQAPGRPITQQPIQERNQPPNLTRFTVEYVQ